MKLNKEPSRDEGFGGRRPTNPTVAGAVSALRDCNFDQRVDGVGVDGLYSIWGKSSQLMSRKRQAMKESAHIYGDKNIFAKRPV